MIEEMQKLKLALQMLALPVTGQVRLAGDDCARVLGFAQVFNAAHRAVHKANGGELLPEQAWSLARLDDQLDRLCRESTAPFCCELTMRTSSDWRQVRLMAREALIQFKWMLELPTQAVLSENVFLN